MNTFLKNLKDRVGALEEAVCQLQDVIEKAESVIVKQDAEIKELRGIANAKRQRNTKHSR